MKELFNVSASPHIRSEETTGRIMADVVIALMPASIFGVYQFGLRALAILLLSVFTCVLTEYIWDKAMKKPRVGYECSALVTGLLLGMNLPVTVPFWIPVLGGVFAIVVVKQLFGGLGQNIMNPALAARCFLLICVPGIMTNFDVAQTSQTTTDVMDIINRGAASLDGLSGATPLAAIKAGATPNLSNMFFGFTGGTIGETSAVMLLLGAIYLLWRKVISFHIPVAYLASFVVFLVIFSGNGFDFQYIAMQLFGGGLMLGAFFMATDYVTCPITETGRIVYGILLGILTGIFRLYGVSAEGVSYAIILGNLFVPLIENVTLPKSFGKGGKANA